jgi:hypothetical protein
MRLSRKFSVALQLGTLAWSLLTPQFVSAYDHPLSAETVREAYFIGQDVKTVNTFLSRYVQALPVPQSGPQVAEIAVSTPYAQVVEASAQHSVGYSAQQAAEDYRKRGDFIVVRVKILFTPTYTNYAQDFWRTVSVGLIQKKHIAATKVHGQPVYSGDEYGSQIIGADVFADFSVAGVKSDSLQVEVVPPGGPAVRTTFDLTTLR